MIFLIFLLFGLFVGGFPTCDVPAKQFLVRDVTCGCPDLMSLMRGRNDTFHYFEGPGCSRNVSCRRPMFISYWNMTTLPPPDDARVDRQFRIMDTTVGFNNFLDTFGISCENNKWTISKYPGVLWYREGISNVKVLNGTEVNGGNYKSEFVSWTW